MLSVRSWCLLLESEMCFVRDGNSFNFDLEFSFQGFGCLGATEDGAPPGLELRLVLAEIVFFES